MVLIPPTHAELFPVKGRAEPASVPLRQEEYVTPVLSGAQKTGADFHRPGVSQDSCGAAARLRQAPHWRGSDIRWAVRSQHVLPRRRPDRSSKRPGCGLEL